MTAPEETLSAATGGAGARRATFNGLAAVIGLLAGALAILSLAGSLAEERLVHRIHDAAPGLLFLFIIAAACAGLLGARRYSVAAIHQLIVGVAGMSIGLALGGSGGPIIIVVVALVLALAVLHPLRAEILTAPRRPSPLMTAIALGVALPLGWYGVQQASQQRFQPPTNPHAAEAHYAVMAGTALAFALVALMAASRPDGWRLPAWSAGLGVAALGALSVATPNLAGSFGAAWGAAAITGGAALIVAAEVEARRPAPQGRAIEAETEPAFDRAN